MDDVFRALADPTRRRLLDSLNERNGQNLSDLCQGLDMARQSVTKHLAILEAADLVVTIRRGRERLHYLNAAPIHEIADRWIDHYHRERVRALADLKDALEDNTVQMQSFVYKTYIKTTPEQLWRGLTEPEFTKRYWNNELVTDWKPGSPMTWNLHGQSIEDPEQVVVEADPYRKLSYTWHTMTPGLAAQFGLGRRAVRQAGGRAPFDGHVRDRGPRQPRQADRDPRRLRARQHRHHDGQRGMAARPLRAEDAARDRRRPRGCVGVR